MVFSAQNTPVIMSNLTFTTQKRATTMRSGPVLIWTAFAIAAFGVCVASVYYKKTTHFDLLYKERVEGIVREMVKQEALK